MNARHALNRWLRESGTTQEELARRAGTHQPKISLFLNGKGGLSARVAFRIEEITGGRVSAKKICAVRVRRPGGRGAARQPQASLATATTPDRN